MFINHTKLVHGALFFALAFLSGCGGGGGGGGGTTPPATYTIGGKVSGLTGTGLVLQNNGGDNLSVSANGSFVFATSLANGSAYNVTVKTQPNGQICSANPYTGTVSSAKVTNVAVTCTATSNAYTIGGKVSGLTGSGLVLQNNGGDNLTISANGNFTFTTPVANGTTYTVIVKTQPSGQICSVNPYTGTVSAANITNVAVTCTATSNAYTIGGKVSGLTGSGLVLQNNGSSNLSVSANGSFVFATPQGNGTAYNVTVLTQPSGQTCVATNSTGTVLSANVTTVAVTCASSSVTYTVGGTVSGLTGSGLVLQNNGGNNLSVSANGSFTFTTPLASGMSYTVTVKTQPSGQICSVGSYTGTVSAANVSNVAVTCITSTSSYTIGGSVTGLSGTGLILQNNGGNNLSLSANGSFVFTTSLADGSTYNVTVLSQPSGQICSVSPYTGTVSGANVSNVAVTCATVSNSYTIGGKVTGLSGTGLVLQNNGGNNLSLSANGNFVFTTPLTNGAPYAVKILTQPTGQTCTVTHSTGTVSGANVTNVAVTCTTNIYTIGGSVTGLTGSGLVLQNNGGDNLSPSANGSFVFATPVANSATYSVTVLTQPTGQTCTVSNSTGTVSGANVTNVVVSCAATSNSFTIGGNVTGLSGGTSLVLQDNGGDDLSISANGSFVFATPVANGSTYQVTVLTQPSGQTCTVSPTIGAVNGANVTSVAVTCSANTYTIGGTITGLSASGLVLQNNGGDDLSLNSGASSFTFATAISNNASYLVTVLTQPTGQTCTVSSPSGTVSAANVTSVSVACSTNTYTISGSISTLTGSGLVLQNNGGDNVTVSPGATTYAFATQLAYGSTYNVTVLTQPTSPNQICTVSATGTITADVTNANVTCVYSYTIGGTITGAANGIGPILQNNGGDNLFIPTVASGVPTTFTFSTPIPDATNYAVTQRIRGRSPSQDCSAITGGGNGNGSGTVAGTNVTSVSITCVLSPIVPKFAFVTNSTANPAALAADTVSAYTIDVGGTLTNATTPTTASGDGPYSVAVDPTGSFAYVANSNADSISAYSIDPITGVLTAIDADGATAGTQASIATGDFPISIAIDPSGKFVYVVNQGNGISTGNTISAYSLDFNTGALTAIDADGATAGNQTTIATGTFPYAVTIDPFGKFVYVANNNSNDVSAYTIDQTTGALTAVAGSPFAAGTNPRAVAIEPTGKYAYAANAGSNDISAFSIDGTTGQLTQINCASNGISTCSGNNYTSGSGTSNPRSIAVDPNTGLYVYVANSADGVAVYTINPSTGELSAVDADAVTGGNQATIAAGSVPISVNVDPSGQFVYVANFSSNNISVYQIGAGGALTLLQTPSAGSGPTSVTTTQ